MNVYEENIIKKCLTNEEMEKFQKIKHNPIQNVINCFFEIDQQAGKYSCYSEDIRSENIDKIPYWITSIIYPTLIQHKPYMVEYEIYPGEKGNLPKSEIRLHKETSIATFDKLAEQIVGITGIDNLIKQEGKNLYSRKDYLDLVINDKVCSPLTTLDMALKYIWKKKDILRIQYRYNDKVAPFVTNFFGPA
jgi:hypothetical protein